MSSRIAQRARETLVANDPVTHGEYWRAIARLDLLDDIRPFRQPVAVISGDSDLSTPPARGR